MGQIPRCKERISDSSNISMISIVLCCLCFWDSKEWRWRRCTWQLRPQVASLYDAFVKCVAAVTLKKRKQFSWVIPELLLFFVRPGCYHMQLENTFSLKIETPSWKFAVGLFFITINLVYNLHWIKIQCKLYTRLIVRLIVWCMFFGHLYELDIYVMAANITTVYDLNKRTRVSVTRQSIDLLLVLVVLHHDLIVFIV